MWVRAGVKATKPAAVLVPVIDRSEPTVLLTLRTAQLASHAGQVAFPGGKIDPADESPVAAALREAKEETGLAPSLIEPIGYLDLYLTFSGFRILPTVARVRPDFTLALNPREVVETFEVPLAFVMAPDNHQRKTRDWNGLQRDYYAIPFENRYIWGITAGILRNLYDRVYAA
jgi:8-oxo-dGTP pyrophosphatase MutT (NUDIX family)